MKNEMYIIIGSLFISAGVSIIINLRYRRISSKFRGKHMLSIISVALCAIGVVLGFIGM